MTHLEENQMLVWKSDDGTTKALKVIRDDDNSELFNPRESIGDDNHMMCWWNRYSLGDKNEFKEPRDCVDALAEKLGFPELAANEDMGCNEILQELSDKGCIAYLPIWIYEHSGISMSCGERENQFTDQFDSGQGGFIYAVKDELYPKQSGVEVPENWQESAVNIMMADVNEYNEWLNGEIYGYELYEVDKNGNLSEEPIDSCWGYIGYDLEESGLLSDIVDVPLDETKVCDIDYREEEVMIKTTVEIPYLPEFDASRKEEVSL